MNKRFLILMTFLGIAILAISFGVRNIVIKRSTRLIDRVDSANLDILEKSLLSSAEGFKAKGDYLKARESLKKFIAEFPDSNNIAKIENDIEKLNIEILFSDIMTEDSLRYKITAGDTLGKIALRFNTTVELLKRVNNLKGDIILPGKFLKVNNVKFNVLIDRSNNILVLRKTDGEVVKRYTVSTGENLSTPIGTFKIEEKLMSPIWYKVGAIVAPDSPEYELGSRWMGLSVEGYGIHGTKDISTIGKHMTKGCIRMLNEDVEELYAIVPSGTEVIIIE